jgi:hypothetical protein
MSENLNITQLSPDMVMMPRLDLVNLVRSVSKESAQETARELRNDFKTLLSDQLIPNSEAAEILGLNKSSFSTYRKWIPKSDGKVSMRFITKVIALGKDGFEKWLMKNEPTAYEAVKQYF